MDNTALKEQTTIDKNLRLEKILVLDFFDALKEGNPKLIGENVTIDDLDNLYIDYLFLVKEKDSVLEKKIKALEKKHYTNLKLLSYLLDNDSDEIVDMLKTFGIIINSKGDVEVEIEKNDKLLLKIEILKSSLPKEFKPVNNDDEENNIYNTITKMSVALGYDLDYEKLTVVKFVNYIKELNKKDA